MNSLLALIPLLIGTVPTGAQTPAQQYVYGSVPVTTTTSEVAGLSKGQTGILSSVAGSPFLNPFEGGSVAVDGNGRFLFVANPTSETISMFQIDQSTGGLAEVPFSPFSAGSSGNPLPAPNPRFFLATEKSGQFLYVGANHGDFEGTQALSGFRIDGVNRQLFPIDGQLALDLPSAPIGLLSHPTLPYLYVGLGPNPAPASPPAGTYVYAIDPATGHLAYNGNAGGMNPKARCIAVDPQGRFFFDGWGSSQGFVESALIAPNDGTAANTLAPVSLGTGNFPSAMLVENSGKFLYVFVQKIGGAFVFPIDQATGALGQPQGPQPTLNFQTGSAVADPQGPYIYSLQQDGIHGFLIDPQSGALSEIPGSPFFSASAATGGIAISGAPVQAVSGPAAVLFPPTANFGSTTVGQSSSPQAVHLTNTGQQDLILSGIVLTGANRDDFSFTSHCLALLQPNHSCAVDVIFSPGTAGLRQATLTANDNAPGSSQSVPLSGMGVAQQPAVTLIPGSLSFPNLNQGSASPSQDVVVTNSGMATLHISSVALSGSNPNDFQMTNGCNGAYSVNATCTIGVAFLPHAAGLRTASISITDDAPGSPRSVHLSGTGIGSPSPTTPNATFAPSTIFFRDATQGATSTPQTITVTNSGTAPLRVSSVQLSGTHAADFSIINQCNPNASYAPNTACSIGLTFTPISTGQHTALLTIADNAPNPVQTIAISGTANPAFTVAPSVPGGQSVTVTAGQTATYNLQLVPGPGFVGKVSFACAGAPLAATCTSLHRCQ